MTEQEIRDIVRDELQTALRTLQAEAENYPDYDSDTIEDKAAHMVGRVAERTADVLRHKSECKIRNGGRYYWDCDCGVKDED
jgi:hypothetical protein